MTPLTIAHTADCHLNAEATAAGRIIKNAAGQNIRWLDRVRCLGDFADDASKRSVDLVVIAGDLFDRPKPTPLEYSTANMILDLLAANRNVVVIGDNHGNPEATKEYHAIAPLWGRSSTLHVLTSPGVSTIQIDRSRLVNVGVLPSPRRSITLAREEYRGLTPEQVNGLISDKLEALLASMRAKLEPGIPSILVAHVMVEGSDLGGPTEVAELGAVSVRPEALAGWDYVALGDIHKAQHVGPAHLPAYYSGSLDRIDFGEEHDPKGWNLVTLTPGQAPVVERIESPARRFLTLAPDDLLDEKHLAMFSQTSNLDTLPIVRVKGQITQDAVTKLGPVLAQWRQFPTFVEQLEIVREARCRADISGTLTAEQALKVWADANGQAEKLPALLEEHARIAALVEVG